MSERGSFITDFIYCDKCFSAAKKVLMEGDWDGWITDQTIIGNKIIAGFVKGHYPGEEFTWFDGSDGYPVVVEMLEKDLCHQMRVAVISDGGGERVFTIAPQKRP